MENISFIHYDNFSAEILNHKGIVFLYFWAPWCGPCKAMKDLYPKLNAEYGLKAKFCQVNASEYFDIAASMHVESLPTVVAFVDGKEVSRKVGLGSPKVYTNWVEEVVHG